MSDDTDGPERLGLEWMEGDMPYSTAFGDHFYCRTDGRAECGHVFLAGNGLPERWRAGGAFRIGELGFGTGLNFCETWRVWNADRGGRANPHSGETPPLDGGFGKTPPQPLPTRGRGLSAAEPLPLVGRGWGGEIQDENGRGDSPGASRQLHFVPFELHPMDKASIDRALARWPEIEAERQALIEAWPESPGGVIDLRLADDVRLTVLCGDALASLAASGLAFDAWYLDGFAPSRNAAMWSAELMAAVHDHTVAGGTFATYAAAGFVRRNLAAAGFSVERRPGFAGKREMLAGVKAG